MSQIEVWLPTSTHSRTSLVSYARWSTISLTGPVRTGEARLFGSGCEGRNLCSERAFHHRLWRKLLQDNLCFAFLKSFKVLLGLPRMKIHDVPSIFPLSTILGLRVKMYARWQTGTVTVKGIYPAPDIHEHFTIHNGYGKLRTSSRTTSTTLSTLRTIA